MLDTLIMRPLTDLFHTFGANRSSPLFPVLAFFAAIVDCPVTGVALRA